MRRMAPPRPDAAASATPPRRWRVHPLTISWLLVVLAIGALIVWRCTSSGHELGSMPVPGSSEFELPAGTELSFTADTDVLFRDFSEDATPEGCELSLVLSQDDRELERVSCDLYSSREGVSIASSQTYGVDRETGMRRLVVERQRLSCRLRPPAAGGFTIQADSNLASCVPRSLSAVVHVVATTRQ
jgi:hypothetical protein